MEPAIIDRGRGPEIAGSRITVYDVLAETRAGTPVETLAGWWHLTVEQIEFALRYIEDHREEVERNWAEIRARHARQREESERLYAARVAERGHSNPEMWEKLQRAKAAWEARRERDPDRHESPGANGSAPNSLGESGVE
jgi:uncharacterized protein (DUF433 family)